VTGRSRHFVVIVHPRKDDGPSRVGIVASKHVGNAVVRNRGKRKIREWFREFGDGVPDRMDVVVILRRGAPDLAAADVGDEIAHILPRLIAKAQKLHANTPTCTNTAGDTP
jgi:ribonuclease P protein component